jgi:hypothetical protein
LSGAKLGINKRALYPHCPRPLVHFPHFDGATGDELIKSANTAMYSAKTHESGCGGSSTRTNMNGYHAGDKFLIDGSFFIY